MNKILTTLALAATTSIVGAQTIINVPGGGFEPSDSNYGNIMANTWSGGDETQSFVTSGGNPNGYLNFTQTGIGNGWGFGVSVIGNQPLVSNPITLSSLGLSSGGSYIGLVDMRCAGSSTVLGALSIEYIDAAGNNTGVSGVTYPSGPGTTSWDTYAFPFTIAPGSTYVRFVCNAAPHSSDLGNLPSVDFDNVRVVVTAVPEPSTIALLGMGLALPLVLNRRRK